MGATEITAVLWRIFGKAGNRRNGVFRTNT